MPLQALVIKDPLYMGFEGCCSETQASRDIITLEEFPDKEFLHTTSHHRQ
jgi:hypothetical protein